MSMWSASRPARLKWNAACPINANHTDAECPICFDECEATERKNLHGDMQWLCKDCLTDMLSRPQAQYTCPTCRHDLDAPTTPAWPPEYIAAHCMKLHCVT